MFNRLLFLSVKGHQFNFLFFGYRQLYNYDYCYQSFLGHRNNYLIIKESLQLYYLKFFFYLIKDVILNKKKILFFTEDYIFYNFFSEHGFFVNHYFNNPSIKWCSGDLTNNINQYVKWIRLKSLYFDSANYVAGKLIKKRIKHFFLKDLKNIMNSVGLLIFIRPCLDKNVLKEIFSINVPTVFVGVPSKITSFVFKPVHFTYHIPINVNNYATLNQFMLFFYELLIYFFKKGGIA